MKIFIFSLLLFSSFFISENLFAQKKDQARIDSLFVLLSKTKDDSAKVQLYNEIFSTYLAFHAEEGLKYINPALQLAEKINSKYGIAEMKTVIGRLYWRLGKFDEALKYHNDVLKIYEESGDKNLIGSAFTCIGQDYADNGKYPEALEYFSKALEVFKEVNDKASMASIYELIAWVYANQGNFAESAKMNYECLKIYEELGDRYSAAITMSNIGENYTLLGNYTEALKYFARCIKPIEDNNDQINLSNTYCDIGKVYKITGNYPEALKNYHVALQIAEKINDNYTIALAYSNIGELYEIQNQFDMARENYLHSIEMFKAIFNKQELAGVYNKIGVCYIRLNKYDDAKISFANAFELSKQLESKIITSDYYNGIQLLDSLTGNWKSAYLNYRKYIVGRDSIYNQESTKKIVQAQMQYDSDKKDIRQRTIRNSIASGLAGTLIFLVVVYRQRNKISKARKRSDELLLNILPEETAEELKATGAAKARDYQEVTVMFTDFKNFTSMSEELSAQELVNEINFCYSAFDNIITKYGIEKIKTIGDSYMCAAGLPHEKASHATDAVNAALEIVSFIETEKQKRAEAGLSFFEIRIGLHSGPVVAGIVGIKKFAYDIWGDAVNIASRMESSGETGKVNISGSTYELVKDKFNCIHRGKIAAKNKGEIDMYFVENKS